MTGSAIKRRFERPVAVRRKRPKPTESPFMESKRPRETTEEISSESFLQVADDLFQLLSKF